VRYNKVAVDASMGLLSSLGSTRYGPQSFPWGRGVKPDGYIDIFPKRCCERTGESCLRRSGPKTRPAPWRVAQSSIFQESGCICRP